MGSFSINTNIASLDAQNYLRMDSNFQTSTINQVTSGLRIVNSGDDAAGLAIANGLQASQAVLTQGIQNATNGLATLQTIDGGMNNISQLLDRASTLAAQSGSSSFSGDRTVLNQEFQSVLSEVNREAQAIGLNTGGSNAINLGVFMGGGTASGNTTAIQNGSVNVDLSHSTVDSQALGLSGFSATGNSATDIGTGAGATSVANILASSANANTETQPGYTTMYFSGPGFSSTNGSNRVAISVNLNGVTNATSLATAINSAIQASGNGATQQATAFKNANITASVYTNPTTNASSLQFTSSNSAFQVEAGDQMSNALLGNVVSSTAVGQSVAAATSTANVTTMLATSANVGAETVNLSVSVGGTATPVQFTIGAGEAQATTLTNLNSALATAGAGVTAALDGSGKLQFTATNSNQAASVNVQVSGDTSNVLGLGSFATDGSANTSYTHITAASALTAADSQNIQIAIGNQVADLGSVGVGAAIANSIGNLNTAFQSNALTRAAGLTAVDNGGKVEIESNNSTAFRLNAYGAGTNGFGFTGAGSVDSSTVGGVSGSAETGAATPSLDAQGTSTSGFLNFSGLTIAGNSQTVSLTAPDSSGSDHSISFSLSSSNAGTIDAALSTINNQLLQSNDPTLQSIVAVKDQSNGVDGIAFESSLQNFSLSLGTTATGTASAGVIQGISQGTGATSQGGAVIESQANGSGSTADISTLQNAQNAVVALTNAVTSLGRAQAAVGKGENLFNYATNLAQSQVTNEAAAESGIKDADLATEASNLSKAQILVQAGTAALAQANSAPQAILSLLQGH
jgi:flagellin